MSMTPYPTISGQAAAAALAGEREYMSIAFVRTGDKPADLMVCMLAAVDALGLTVTEAAEVAEYLTHRWRRTVADLDIRRQSLERFQAVAGQWSGSIPQGATPNSLAQDYSQYVANLQPQTSGKPPGLSGSGMSSTAALMRAAAGL